MITIIPRAMLHVMMFTCVPSFKQDVAVVGSKPQWVDLNTDSCYKANKQKYEDKWMYVMTPNKKTRSF